MQQAGYHYANTLAEKVTKDINKQLQERDNNMLVMLQSIPSLTESSTNKDSDSTPPVAVNFITTTDGTQLAIL